MSQLYWINGFSSGNLAIMAAPRVEECLNEVLLAWKEEGVDIVVSLVEDVELPGLVDAERELCQEFGLDFRHFPVRDKTTPLSLEPILTFSKQLASAILAGHSLAIHCRAGIGRSALLAACVLACLGIEGAAALDMIAEARGIEIPETEAQRQWVLSFSHAMRLPSSLSRNDL